MEEDDGPAASRPYHRAGLTRRFLRLAVPNILANLLVPLASLIDVALLGHLSEIRYLGGVALGTVLFDYVYWTFGFLRMGTTGLTAQARGRGDIDGEILVGLRGATLAASLGLAVVALQWPLREVGFALLQGSAGLESAGREYFDARIWGAPAALLNFVWLGWFLGREQSKRALVMSAVGHGTNIVLDWVFIRELGWAARGAGAATAISQYAMLATALSMSSSATLWPRARRVAGQVLDTAAWRDFFGLSGDITVRTLLLVSTFAVFTNLAATMGAAVLAATAVLRTVVMFGAYFVDGYAFATESLTGVFQGAHDRDRLRDSLRISMVWGLATGAALGLAFLVFPAPLLGILTDHVETLELLDRYVIWLLPVLVLGAPAYVLDGYFLGLTRGRALRRAMVASVLLGFAPWAAWAWWASSAHLLWLALSLFMVARAWTLGRQVPATLAAVGARSSSR